jgi:hypothetical protein
MLKIFKDQKYNIFDYMYTKRPHKNGIIDNVSKDVSLDVR